MPAIRLADIPNAPSLPTPSGGAGITTASVVRGSNSMLDQTLELDAFSQEARAAGRFAEAIGQIGNVAMEWGQKFAKAKDDADISRAETILESTRQKQLIEQEKLPVEQWQDNWIRNQEQAKRALSEIKMSRNASEQLMPALERWSTLSTLEVSSKAQRRQLDGFKMDAEIAYKRELAKDNLDGAFDVISRFEKNGTLSPQEAEKFRFDVEIETIRKSKAERNANLESAIILDPQNWERDLMEGLKTGSSKLQTDLSREEINRLLPYARQQSRVAEVDKMALIEDMVLKGEFQTREELVKAMEDKKRPDLMPNVQIPERAKQSLLATFEQSPEKQMESIKLIPAMIKKIESFDFSEDQNLEKYISLASEVRSLPEGYRKEPLDLLYEKFRDFKESRKPVPANALSQIKKMAAQDLDAGGYGKWETDENKLPTEATRKAYIEANLRYSQEMTALENWAKANPDKAKVDTEVYRAHNDIITQQNKLDAAAGRPLTRKPVDLKGVPAKPDKTSGPPDPDEVLRTAPKGASATSKPVGKVTSYNFPGDPYSDTNSRNLIGAWNNRLTESSLAISPDIEKKFKAAGIKQGDSVELTLANGTRVVRNWDDRTMQDEQAIRKFGKPLRGRFDFHQPGGKYENDGVAVVSFRKATAA